MPMVPPVRSGRRPQPNLSSSLPPSARRLAGLLAGTCALGLTASLALAAPSDAAPSARPASPSTSSSTSTSTATGTSTATTAKPVQTRRAFGSGSMGWRNEERAIASGQARMRTSTTQLSRAARPGGVLGVDVASYQGNVRWSSYRAAGKQFAYVKATEGVSYRNPYFPSQFNGSAAAGLMHGAYHFAAPSSTSGAAQANYFVGHGGRWVRDGKTLPGVLDIEYNPYGSVCYGLSKPAMVAWIKSFTTQYKKLTGRDAVIYTTADWWTRCTGNTTAFSQTNPLWVARYASAVGTLPGRWPFYTFWQYSSSPVDQDQFSASLTRLRVLARG